MREIAGYAAVLLAGYLGGIASALMLKNAAVSEYNHAVQLLESRLALLKSEAEATLKKLEAKL